MCAVARGGEQVMSAAAQSAGVLTDLAQRRNV